MVSFAMLRFACDAFSENIGGMLEAFIVSPVTPRNDCAILETELGIGFDTSAEINAEVTLPMNSECLLSNKIK